MRIGQLLGALIACFAVLLVTGCGSSSSSTSSSTSTASSGLKTDSTPKYAAPASSTPVQSGTVQIAYRNIAINPDTVRVKVGAHSSGRITTTSRTT